MIKSLNLFLLLGYLIKLVNADKLLFFLTKAKAVDVSSGVEKEYGLKSNELISKFCNSVNLYER